MFKFNGHRLRHLERSPHVKNRIQRHAARSTNCPLRPVNLSISDMLRSFAAAVSPHSVFTALLTASTQPQAQQGQDHDDGIMPNVFRTIYGLNLTSR